MKTTSNINQFHKSLIDNLYDGVYFVDTKQLITYWNKGAERITGYPAEAVINQFCHSNILDHVSETGQHYCTEGCPLLATLQDGEPRETEVHLRHADGHRVPVLVRTTPIYDDKNKIIGAVEVFSNNHSLFRMKRRVDELEKAVFRDTLTGLGNRKFLEMKISSALLEYHQHQMPFGLIFLDIDHFKEINDTYGHQEGDHILRNTTKVFSEYVRETDVAGRWGGEEFIALLYNVNQENLFRVAEKIRTMIGSSVITIDGEKVSVTASLGATIANRNDTMETIIERADQLMYQSKQGGRNKVTTG